MISCMAGYSQAPDLHRGKEIWRGTWHEVPVRIVQIPKNPLVLTPVRWCIETLGPHDSNYFQSLDPLQLTPQPGDLSARVVVPQTLPIFEWEKNLAECRYTFDMAGRYQLRLHSEPPVVLDFSIAPVTYLSFSKEMTLFIAGCLALGAVLFLLWYKLRQHEIPSDHTPTPSTSWSDS